MTIQHPKFNKLSPSVQETQGVTTPKVHTVAPPDNEDMIFASQMQQVMDSIDQQQQVPIQLDDAILQKELEKKRVLEKLILFRQPVTKEVSIDGMTFKIKLLNPDDNVKVFKELKKLSGDEQIVKTPVMLLAAALLDINGIKLSEVYSGPVEITEPLLQAYYEINKWPVALINTLSTVFQSFTEETEKGFTKDFLKK
jgi:hypothetical protein